MTGVVQFWSGVWHFVWDTGQAVGRLMAALLSCNYQLVTTIVRTASESVRAICSLVISLTTATVEISTYILVLLGEVANLISVCLSYISAALLSVLRVVLTWVIQARDVLATFLAFSWELLSILGDKAAWLLRLSMSSAVEAADKAFTVGISSLGEFVTIASGVFGDGYGWLCHTVNSAYMHLKHSLWYSYDSIDASLSVTVQSARIQMQDLIPLTLSLDYYSAVIILLSIVVLFKCLSFALPMFSREEEEPLSEESDNDIDIYSSDDELPELENTDNVDHNRTITIDDEEEDSGTQSSTDEEEEEDEEEDDDDEEDYEDSEEDNDENNQNAINIELPAANERYNLRGRATPAPCVAKLSPGELERIYESERDKRLCVVCQDQVKSVLLLPCKHMCLCVDCAHEVVGQRLHYRRVCPLCRSRIATVMNVFV